MQNSLARLEPVLCLARCASEDHNDSSYHFLKFKLGRASESVNDVWGALWIAVVSEIWKHKNKLIFKGGVIDVLEIFTLVQLKVWSWVTSKTSSSFFLLF